MQALGSYEAGRMLFLGLGTGLGSAMFVEGHIAPMELAHLPYKHGKTFEDYVGRRGLERLGEKRWQHHVGKVASILKAALVADYVVLGGGNAKLLKKPPTWHALGRQRQCLSWRISSVERRPRVEPVAGFKTSRSEGPLRASSVLYFRNSR